MKSKSVAAVLKNSKLTQDLKPETLVRYFKRPDPFGKSRGSTLSEPVQIVKQYKYSNATDKKYQIRHNQKYNHI